jgi:hypothetical protein
MENKEEVKPKVKPKAQPKAQPKSQVSSKIYLQHKTVSLIFTGDTPREFKEAVQRPFPILEKGDVIVTDVRTANFLSRATSPFEKILSKDISVSAKG